MSLNENLIWLLGEARKLQISGIQVKYRKILSEVLKKDIEDIILTELEDSYIVGAWTFGRHFQANEVNALEQPREFSLIA